MDGHFLWLKPASRQDSLYSADPQWNCTQDWTFNMKLKCVKKQNKTPGQIAPTEVIFIAWSHSEVAEQMKRIHRTLTNVRKCVHPRLILLRFNPSFIHLLFLLFFRCTSLLFSSLYHSFPHFLTPSWLL